MQHEGIQLTFDPEVYPPAEDTYLLLEAIDVVKDDLFLEVGCGSGLIAIAAARHARFVIASDISMSAVRNARDNLKRNRMDHKCAVIQTDLLASLSPDAQFSIIAFNPPYLPSDNHTTEMDHALVGGPMGVEVTERFVKQAVFRLIPGGRLYVVVSSQSDISRIRKTMRNLGLKVRTASSTRIFFEILQVLEGTRL
ncbi:MAG: methyltransferase domain-containing protein [Candidatus Thorarchaeota archaeon]|nr:methyltransferase domain-containing protein [Candidatus Thorarchaeota archaeon]